MVVDDLTLRALLTTHSGVYRFAGARVFLVDAIVVGLSRQAMIDNLGLVATKRLMLRLGHAQGWNAADHLNDRLNSNQLHIVVQRLLTVLGLGQGSDPEVGDPGDWPSFSLIRSCEAEQFTEHIGTSSEPVCWFACGFAAGYAARALAHPTTCQEEHCAARAGDALCSLRLRVDAATPIDVTTATGVEAARAHLLRSYGVDDAVISSTLANTEVPERILVGMQSPRMRTALAIANQAARVDSTVLVTGETGVGKGQLARYIHDHSTRRGAPFISVNCAALPENLLEAELFGHARGAFTGAVGERKGLFEAAHGGTIFLDEIGELAREMQSKLLSVLQDREVRRLGETRSRAIDVRVIAATNRDLPADVLVNRFRQDLYYRLDVISLHVPPLRERPDDLRALAELLLREACGRARRPVEGFTASAWDYLLIYDWPGNIRELENIVERACALTRHDHIDVDDLPEHVRRARSVLLVPDMPIRPLAAIEREHILAALKRHGNNKARAAQELGIGLATLYRKLNRYVASAKSSHSK
jgi:two-component system, NtrC family, response regulator HydG